MDSILQEDRTVCYLCHQPATWNDPLDCHHVFFGAMKKKSDKLGLTVMLHHDKCHENGKKSVHKCIENNLAIKAIAQQTLIEEHGWTKERFMQEFYKNYLEE